MTRDVASIAIVPAAGKGSRFGASPKLLARLDGVPLLERTLRSLLDAGVERVVLVAAPDAAFGGLPALADPRVEVVTNRDPARGMFSSIQTGLPALVEQTGSWAANVSPILILPADMPFVLAETHAAVGAACAASGVVILPAYRGRHGHPIALPPALGLAVLAAPVTSTLSDVLKSAGIERRELAVEDPGVLRDVDEPGDLQ